MIRYQELVPDYYIEKSRDFQVLCRLYDFTLNATKYNIDSMNAITDTRRAKDTILPLIGDKFGIYDRESYSNRFLLEALPIALKYKGSLKAVNILINAFLDSQDIFDYGIVFRLSLFPGQLLFSIFLSRVFQKVKKRMDIGKTTKVDHRFNKQSASRFSCLLSTLVIFCFQKCSHIILILPP